jgi:hypothetical protein
MISIGRCQQAVGKTFPVFCTNCIDFSPKDCGMASLAHVHSHMLDDWIAEFKERATPRLRDLFTSDRDFSILPDLIAEPLKRLELAEQKRG